MSYNRGSSPSHDKCASYGCRVTPVALILWRVSRVQLEGLQWHIIGLRAPSGGNSYGWNTTLEYWPTISPQDQGSHDLYWMGIELASRCQTYGQEYRLATYLGCWQKNLAHEDQLAPTAPIDREWIRCWLFTTGIVQWNIWHFSVTREWIIWQVNVIKE